MTDEIKKIILYKINRSYETLEEAEIMGKYNHWNACVNRLYYACFYAVSALLLTENLSSSKHTGVRSLFNKNFVKPGLIVEDLGELYNELFENRQESDYTDFVTMKEDIVRLWIDKTRIFLDKIQILINQKT
jgi:uncharacterized protein (UPF0332 family)